MTVHIAVPPIAPPKGGKKREWVKQGPGIDQTLPDIVKVRTQTGVLTLYQYKGGPRTDAAAGPAQHAGRIVDARCPYDAFPHRTACADHLLHVKTHKKLTEAQRAALAAEGEELARLKAKMKQLCKAEKPGPRPPSARRSNASRRGSREPADRPKQPSPPPGRGRAADQQLRRLLLERSDARAAGGPQPRPPPRDGSPDPAPCGAPDPCRYLPDGSAPAGPAYRHVARKTQSVVRRQPEEKGPGPHAVGGEGGEAAAPPRGSGGPNPVAVDGRVEEEEKREITALRRVLKDVDASYVARLWVDPAVFLDDIIQTTKAPSSSGRDARFVRKHADRLPGTPTRKPVSIELAKEMRLHESNPPSPELRAREARRLALRAREEAAERKVRLRAMQERFDARCPAESRTPLQTAFSLVFQEADPLATSSWRSFRQAAELTTREYHHVEHLLAAATDAIRSRNTRAKQQQHTLKRNVPSPPQSEAPAPGPGGAAGHPEPRRNPGGFRHLHALSEACRSRQPHVGFSLPLLLDARRYARAAGCPARLVVDPAPGADAPGDRPASLVRADGQPAAATPPWPGEHVASLFCAAELQKSRTDRGWRFLGALHDQLYGSDTPLLLPRLFAFRRQDAYLALRAVFREYSTHARPAAGRAAVRERRRELATPNRGLFALNASACDLSDRLPNYCAASHGADPPRGGRRRLPGLDRVLALARNAVPGQAASSRSATGLALLNRAVGPAGHERAAGFLLALHESLAGAVPKDRSGLRAVYVAARTDAFTGAGVPRLARFEPFFAGVRLLAALAASGTRYAPGAFPGLDALCSVALPTDEAAGAGIQALVKVGLRALVRLSAAEGREAAGGVRLLCEACAPAVRYARCGLADVLAAACSRHVGLRVMRRACYATPFVNFARFAFPDLGGLGLLASSGSAPHMGLVFLYHAAEHAHVFVSMLLSASSSA
ncbi:hypothetical protein DIPPA_30010 [Diplonema papillatum]|nr:hypothetical protein DIPPA_30010 [Diplonema papillatum]